MSSPRHPYAVTSAVIRHAADPVLTGLTVTDEPSGRRLIQDHGFEIVLDPHDRVRAARYVWGPGLSYRVPRVPPCPPGAVPTDAQRAQAASDAYWQRVSAAMPRPQADPVASRAADG